MLGSHRTISLGKYGSFPSNLIIGRPYHLTWELLDKAEDENFCRLRVVPAAELYADTLADESAGSDLPPLDEDSSNKACGSASDDGACGANCAGGLVTSAASLDEAAAEVAAADREIKAAAAVAELVSTVGHGRSASNGVRNQEKPDFEGKGVGGDESQRQTLTMSEIEVLKREGARAGRALIEKLMGSHTALDKKTAFSLAKYKLLKTKKYIRRFSVFPFDVARMNSWLLEDKESAKVMDMRAEMLALVGCWSNVHYGGDVPRDYRQPVIDPGITQSKKRKRSHKQEGHDGRNATDEPEVTEQDVEMDVDEKKKKKENEEEEKEEEEEQEEADENNDNGEQEDEERSSFGGRWLVVDDTGGFLTAAMAERMGLLYDRANSDGSARLLNAFGQRARRKASHVGQPLADANKKLLDTETQTPKEPNEKSSIQDYSHNHNHDATPTQETSLLLPDSHVKDDFQIPFAPTNTLTVIHQSGQPNLSLLKYWDFDITSPNLHRCTLPLASHLLPISWLQLLDPEHDNTYSTPPPTVPLEVLRTWKGSRRGNYHRKRRRWARARYIVTVTRQRRSHSGLVMASAMDPISVLRHTLPLLAGGAPVAVYSANIETLMPVADCFSLARRAAWASTPPPEAEGKSMRELEEWSSRDFPLNPSLLLGVTVHTSRVRHWQVHPGRTHPMMTSRGGPEGYVLTGYRAIPAEGKVEARGKFKKRRVEA